MNGVLLVDKPQGPTSHDIVAWARRRLGTRAVGHAGTLDPMATGLLVLMIGSATRLSSLLTGSDKTYEAEIRLGYATDTDDAEGSSVGAVVEALPTDQRIREALEAFVGPIRQRPPAHSAKKVGGRPAYKAARRHEPVDLRTADVVLRSVEWKARSGDRVALGLTVSSGFYVRALARDLGERLGCGAHLSGLRRTSSGPFRVEQAVALADAEAPGAVLSDRLIQPAEALPHLPAVRLTEAGLIRARHGNALSPALMTGTAELSGAGGGGDAALIVRILSPDGQLVALGRWRSGALHPVAVLI